MGKPNKSAHYNTEATPKRAAQRMRLSLAMKLIQSDYIDLLNVSYASQIKKGNAYNAFSGHLIKDVITGEYPNLTYDFEKLRISRGKLEAPRWAIVTIIKEGYLIEWDLKVKDLERLEDYLILFAYEKQKQNIVTNGNILKTRRKDGQFFLATRDTPSPSDMKFWLGFCNKEKTQCCDSLYIKEIPVEEAQQYQLQQQQFRQELKLEEIKQSQSEDSACGDNNIDISKTDNASPNIQTALPEEQKVCVLTEPLQDDFSDEAIIDIIKQLREKEGLNQTQLGERIGKARSQISKLESGDQKVKTSTFQEILKALNYKIEFRIVPDDKNVAGT
ncbi:XRE family transcriptional regulator [Puteibacter caeruleilacunae]|nr:XRE family transcriptional regulator [Puteibacter caeruleilacunae]